MERYVVLYMCVRARVRVCVTVSIFIYTVITILIVYNKECETVQTNIIPWRTFAEYIFSSQSLEKSYFQSQEIRQECQHHYSNKCGCSVHNFSGNNNHITIIISEWYQLQNVNDKNDHIIMAINGCYQWQDIQIRCKDILIKSMLFHYFHPYRFTNIHSLIVIELFLLQLYSLHSFIND